MTESDADFEMLENRLSQLTHDERILVGAGRLWPLASAAAPASTSCLSTDLW